MSDEEYIIQISKIGLGVIALVILSFGIYDLNKNIVNIIKQNGQIIEILKQK